MKKVLQRLWKNYRLHTPKKWRKMGDALLAVSVFLSVSEITLIPNWGKWLAIGTIVLGAAGKFLTNFFSEEK